MYSDHFKRTQFKLQNNDRAEVYRYRLHQVTAIVIFLVALVLLFYKMLISSIRWVNPGIVILMIIAVLMFYCIKEKNLKRSSEILFFLPIALYFFYFSEQYANIPVVPGFVGVIHVLILSFFLFLLLTDSTRQFVIFWSINTLSLVLELTANSFWPLLLKKADADSEMIVNCLILYAVASLLSFLIALIYRAQIDHLFSEVGEMKRNKRAFFENIGEPALLLEYPEESAEPDRLKIVAGNHSFESVFEVVNSHIQNQTGQIVFPEIFGDSFNWKTFYFPKRKDRSEIYANRIQHYFEVSLIPLEGRMALSLFHDISEEKICLKNSEESRARYKALLEAIPDIFFVIDSAGIFRDFVAKEEDLKDIVPSEIIGSSIYDYGFSEQMTQTIYQCIKNVIAKNTFETIEYALSSSQGTLLFEMRMVRLNTYSVIALSRDITKRKYAERNLEIAKSKAEESDRLKSAFLANLSHEIRTPMNAIIGFTRMLSAADFSDEEKKDFLGIIVDNGEQLMSMLDDVIDISKVETGQVEVHQSFCKLNGLLGELYAEFAGMKEKQTNQSVDLVVVNGNDNPNFAIYIDATLLREIYMHLIDNAIKFTDHGEVHFGYYLEENCAIRFFVKDTGIGIPDHQKEKIFLRFHKLNEPGGRIYRGAGLGLSIAQNYVQKLGGQLSVDSEEGEGSCFSFVLKMERVEGALRIV